MQNDVVITKEKVEKVVNKMPNWKSPGFDLVQGFCLQRFTNLQSRITCTKENYITAKRMLEKKMLTWMTKERTILIVKDPQKGSVPSKYRLITCIAMCWKSLTRILAGEIYLFMENQNIVPEEQRRKDSSCPVLQADKGNI